MTPTPKKPSPFSRKKIAISIAQELVDELTRHRELTGVPVSHQIEGYILRGLKAEAEL